MCDGKQGWAFAIYSAICDEKCQKLYLFYFQFDWVYSIGLVGKIWLLNWTTGLYYVLE